MFISFCSPKNSTVQISTLSLLGILESVKKFRKLYQFRIIRKSSFFGCFSLYSSHRLIASPLIASPPPYCIGFLSWYSDAIRRWVGKTVLYPRFLNNSRQSDLEMTIRSNRWPSIRPHKWPFIMPIIPLVMCSVTCYYVICWQNYTKKSASYTL